MHERGRHDSPAALGAVKCACCPTALQRVDSHTFTHPLPAAAPHTRRTQRQVGRHERAATDGWSEIKTRIYEEEERDDILTERERRARTHTHTAQDLEKHRELCLLLYLSRQRRHLNVPTRQSFTYEVRNIWLFMSRRLPAERRRFY